MSNRRLSPNVAMLATAALLLNPVSLSDPVGIYAVIDRVILEPDSANPSRIQIWGVFALSPRQPGDAYLPAQRGYLYYASNARNERASRAEWSDLRAIAGTGQPIGFGARFEAVGRVRRASESPANPDTYPLGFGLVKTSRNPLASAINRDLFNVPAPLSPADGERLAAGPVRLITRNVPDSTVRYIFEIETGGSVRETSDPITPGRTQTAWSPKLRVEAGQEYTWRVRVTGGTWRGQPATSAFRVGT